MAAFHGKNGRVFWNVEDGVSAVELTKIQSWSATATVEVSETTSMGSTWKSYEGGVKDWTATVECLLDATGPEVPYAVDGSLEGLGDSQESGGNYVWLELWFGATEGAGILVGPAICTNINTSSDKGDIAKVTYEFQGNGLLDFATTAKATDFDVRE